MKRGYKKCPFCANEIKEGAVKCSFCETEFNGVNIKTKHNEKPSKITGSIVIIIILCIVIILLLGIIVEIYFENNHVINQIDSNVSNNFEKKEQCLKYFDKYRNYLKEQHESDSDDLKMYLDEYEMFYNSDLDTCISAYSFHSWMRDSQGENRPGYYFHIVDYLNGEKELFNCREDTYFEHLQGNEVGKKGAECQDRFWEKKDLLKK